MTLPSSAGPGQAARSLRILSIALAFSFSETAWPVVLTVVPTALLVLLEVSPSRRNADRTAARLERDGSPSHLHRALGLA